jgi:hypothetical protein
MKNENLIAALALLGLGAYWLSQRGKAKGSKVSIGRVETSTSTQAGVEDIVDQAEKLATENEDPSITRLRTDILQFGVRVNSCEVISGKRYCQLSNGWKLPSWLVIDYLGLDEP